MGPISSPVSQKYLACRTGSRWIGCHTHIAANNQCTCLGFSLLGSWLMGVGWLTAVTQKHKEIPVHWHISNNNSILCPDGRQWLLALAEHCRDRTSFPISCMFDTGVYCWPLLGFLVVLMNNYKPRETYNCNFFYYFTLSARFSFALWVVSHLHSLFGF